ncbi:MAG: fructose-1,6-bisphosphate aldolase/phosphatase [Candidatus Aenigmatarchaeota archaeon]
MKVTLSVIKADIGGYPGHCSMHPDIMKLAREELSKSNLLIDFKVLHCGDDLELIMTHTRGIEDKGVHKLAWDTFVACTELAKKLKLYGAGQDLLADTFSGNVKGMGPGVAEMEIEERPSEPIVIFMADKTEPGAWNLPLYKMFADPFSTAGLVIDPKLHPGFTFEVHDVMKNRMVEFKCPQEMYDMLVYIGAPGRYCIKSVKRNTDNEVASVSSTQKLNLMAGKYVGKDDPVCIVRSQSGFPALGEVLEPFSFPHIVGGWMRGSHHGPLMPVGFEQAAPTRFDGPPRVIAAGFQLAEGKLLGPTDLFKDVSFDETRRLANRVADVMRRHGPFEPHRLSLDEMEYTTLPEVEKRLKERWKTLK